MLARIVNCYDDVLEVFFLRKILISQAWSHNLLSSDHRWDALTIELLGLRWLKHTINSYWQMGMLSGLFLTILLPSNDFCHDKFADHLNIWCNQSIVLHNLIFHNPHQLYISLICAITILVNFGVRKNIGGEFQY